MGLTVLEIEVSSPATPDVTETVDFLIDSCAVYSVVPAQILVGLGIRPLTEHTFRLADGFQSNRQKGVAVFRYGDRIGGADVLFGEEGDCSLLGAFTLEALGLSLDPLRRELRQLADVADDTEPGWARVALCAVRVFHSVLGALRSDNMMGTDRLVEEHNQLSQAWLEAEQIRVEILEQLIKEHGGQCTMDYPENMFQGYDEALGKAAVASRAYVLWLAQQGFPSR